jgi:hypothetical protein
MVGRLFSAGIAVVLVGAVGAVPAAATSGLHVVASPFIANSSLAGAAVIAPGDMWAAALTALSRRSCSCRPATG